MFFCRIFSLEERFPARTLIHLSAGSSLAKITEIYLKPTCLLKKAIPWFPIFYIVSGYTRGFGNQSWILFCWSICIRSEEEWCWVKSDFPNWHGHRSLEDIAVSYGTNWCQSALDFCQMLPGSTSSNLYLQTNKWNSVRSFLLEKRAEEACSASCCRP